MKPNKLKRNLIILFSVIFIIATIIFVLYNTTDIFRTKRGAFFRYFAQLPETFDILDTSNKYKTYKKAKENKSYTTNGEMTITDSNNIADQNILKKLKLTVSGKTDNKNEKSNTNVLVKSENNELFNMQVARDKNLYGFFEPQIADGYIVLRNDNLNELAKNMQLENAKNIPEQIIPINMEKILEISDVEKKHLSNYIKMIKNGAPDTSYMKKENEKIEIEGKKYNTTAYTLKLSPQENTNLQIALLEKMTTDSIMMNFITSKCKLMNLNKNLTDINTLNSNMKKWIEKIRNNPEQAGEFSMTVYENKQKNIQTKIEFGGKVFTINYVKENEQHFFILKVENDLKKTVIKIEQKESEYTVKFQTEENKIVKSYEFKYNITGTIEENNIENHLKTKIVDDIKMIEFEYNDKVNFTNDIGTLKEMQEDKIAVINDYDPEYIKEFIELVKKQINTVYIEQGASIGINLEPIFIVK